MIRKNLIYGNENIGEDIVELLSKNNECEMIEDTKGHTTFKANTRRQITLSYGVFILDCKEICILKDESGKYDYVFLDNKSSIDIKRMDLSDDKLGVRVEVC